MCVFQYPLKEVVVIHQDPEALKDLQSLQKYILDVSKLCRIASGQIFFLHSVFAFVCFGWFPMLRSVLLNTVWGNISQNQAQISEPRHSMSTAYWRMMGREGEHQREHLYMLSAIVKNCMSALFRKVCEADILENCFTNDSPHMTKY